jgi:hypothetical protein
MKITSMKFVRLLLAVFSSPAISAFAQITFNVSPTAVSSAYTGVVTLQIGGVTNGEQVIFQNYLDANSNGIVDAGESLINAFRINESGASVIAGVTNYSAPYDANPATNAITTTINFTATLDNLVGQRILRIVSPTARFTPASVLFNVTNSALAQSVGGRVLANGATPVPGALVVALQSANQNYVVATVTDNTGHYTLSLNPGSYLLIAGAQNTYADQNSSPIVTLIAGHSVTNDLFLTNGTVALGGTVVDAGNSNTLSGVFLQIESDNLIALTFTDTNGNFSTMVNPGKWKVKADAPSLSRRGYAVPQGGITVNTTGGAVTNVGLKLNKGNSLFYGKVIGPTGGPLANYRIVANTDNAASEAFKSDVFTDQNGNYGAAVFFDTNNIPATNGWNCSAGGNPAFASLLVSSGLDAEISSNQALLVNFTTLAATAVISGRLHDTSGNPLSSVSISGNTIINGNSYTSLGANTDANGNFSFAAANGEWFVSADCCDDSGLSNLGFYDPVPHNVLVNSTAYVDITAYPDNTPVIYNPQIINSSNFAFLVSAPNNPPGNHYSIMATTNLSSPSPVWTMVLTTNLNGSSTYIVDTNAVSHQRFYRVSVGP